MANQTEIRFSIQSTKVVLAGANHIIITRFSDKTLIALMPPLSNLIKHLQTNPRTKTIRPMNLDSITKNKYSFICIITSNWANYTLNAHNPVTSPFNCHFIGLHYLSGMDANFEIILLPLTGEWMDEWMHGVYSTHSIIGCPFHSCRRQRFCCN